MIVRAARGEEADRLAEIWERGWREAHLGRVPDALARVRTPETFLLRARAQVPWTTVALVDGTVAGFVTVVDDEVEQLYVGAAYRGSGAAVALLGAAEDAIAAAGFPKAWLAVVAENTRARRFYTRHGWTDEGDLIYRARTHEGPVDVPCRRYGKSFAVRRAATQADGDEGASGPGEWDRIPSEDGLLLRAPTPADAAGVLAVHGDPRVYELDPQERHPDLDHSRWFLAPMIDHWNRYGFGYWSVLVPSSWWVGGPVATGAADGARVFAGLGGVRHHEVGGAPVLNVYFRLAPAVHGRGIASRIVDAAAQLRHERFPTTDLVIRTRPANAAARRVAVRAGFVDEGLEPGDPGMQLLRLPASSTRPPHRREAGI